MKINLLALPSMAMITSSFVIMALIHGLLEKDGILLMKI